MASIMALKLGAVSSSGVVLSLPQSSGFESSLTLLKKNYKLTNVFFWGKVMGTAGEYLIAMGTEESYSKQKFFYCQDAVSWAQLPLVTDELVADCAKIEAGLLFTGDAAFEYDVTEKAIEGAEEAPEEKKRTELDRLACTISAIDFECAMLPMGKVISKPGGNIVDSPTYRGLDYSKTITPKSYVFVNKPKVVPATADAVTASTDFLTSCADVVPAGAIVAKFDESTNAVTMRSLLYPGFFAYSFVGAPMAGYCYFGDGMKNADIALMLP